MPQSIYPIISGVSQGSKDLNNDLYPTFEKVQKPVKPVINNLINSQPKEQTVVQPTTKTTPQKTTSTEDLYKDIPEGLDAGTVILQRVIRKFESGNRQVLPGEGAELGGASIYQYTHGTWKAVAKKYLGDENAELNRANENKATYFRILDWKSKGMTPKQIASMWNAGEGRPNAYAENWKGVNKYGVAYDTPAYVNKVYNEFKKQTDAYKKENGIKVKVPNQEQYTENLKDYYSKNVKDENVKELINSGKVSIDNDGNVNLSVEYANELEGKRKEMEASRNELITKLSRMPGVSEDDIYLAGKYFDLGNEAKLKSVIGNVMAGAKAKDEMNPWINWAREYTKNLDALWELKGWKQIKQVTGIGVGALGAVTGGLAGAVKGMVENAVKGVKAPAIGLNISKGSANILQNMVAGAKENYQAGKEMGETGIKGVIYAPLGRIPNALEAIPQVVSGASKLGEGIENKDIARIKEGAFELAVGFASGLPIGKGYFIDTDFFGAAARETDALKSLATGKTRNEIVNNIFNKKIINEIDSNFDSAIKPSFSNRKTVKMAKSYNNDKRNALMSIIDNKENLELLDKSGNVVKGKLPSNIEQLAHSVDQTLNSIFKKYDDLKVKAGEAGVQVDTKNIANQMMEIVNDPKFKAMEDLNPNAVKYMEDLAYRLEKRSSYSPSEAQAMIEELNSKLKAFYRNPNVSEVSNAAIDNSVANLLRKSLDDAITGATGEGYQILRNKYKQLKTIQDDINRAVNRIANAPEKSLLDNITSPFAGAEILYGLASMNPASVARGASINAIRNFYKKMVNPDLKIKKMFNNIDSLLEQRNSRLAGKTLTETVSKMPVGMSIKDVSGETPKWYSVESEKVINKVAPGDKLTRDIGAHGEDVFVTSVLDNGKFKAVPKEQIIKNIQEKQIINKSKPTTKILNELNGKPQVKRQFIEDLLKRPDITKVEKDIINESLKTEGDVIDSKLFAKKVQNELLPLEIKKSDTYKPGEQNWHNPESMIEEGGFTPKYESVSLPEDIRGNVSKYAEHIYESPIKTSAGNVHWQYTSDKYFGHTRIEDMADGTTRRVIENQTDLYQRGRLENEVKNKINETGLVDPESYVKMMKENGYDKKQIQDWENKIPEYKKTVENIKKEVEKLAQYNDPTAHYRMAREEVKLAAQDGKTKLQFPTGETAMKIEGLAGRGNDNFLHYEDSRGLVKSDIVYGQKFNDRRYRGSGSGNFVILDKTGDETFKAVQLKYDAPEILSEHNYGDFTKEYTNALKKYAKENSHLIEEFSIAEKIDTDNPIYKFYEKDLGKYLKNRYGATEITDKNGVKWFEVDIKPEMKNEAVLAFGHTTIEALLKSGALLTGALGVASGIGALIAALAKEKKRKRF